MVKRDKISIISMSSVDDYIKTRERLIQATQLGDITRSVVGHGDIQLITRLLAGVYDAPYGHFRCPQCKRIYKPQVNSKLDSLELDPRKQVIAREQHLSGICSQKCWDDVWNNMKL